MQQIVAEKEEKKKSSICPDSLPTPSFLKDLEQDYPVPWILR